jgi:hypothetical protein
LALKSAGIGFNLIQSVMPITLPDIKLSHCIRLVACGEIKTDDAALLNWLKTEKDGYANLNKESILTLGLGDRTGKHFHLDITEREFVDEKSITEAALSVDEIQHKISNLIGKEIEVDLAAMFEVEINALPENGIIKSLLFKTQLGSVEIKLKGAQLSIKGSPATEINWLALSDGKHIGVTIEAENFKTIISENYLTDALNTLENALNVFILGKTSNEPKKPTV